MVLVTALTLAAYSGSPKITLAAPFRAEAAGQPISVDVGHAAPMMMDWDGDGKRDLLVGQFGEGKLRIYKNIGTNQEPKFDNYEYFKAGGADATVPSG